MAQNFNTITLLFSGKAYILHLWLRMSGALLVNFDDNAIILMK